MALIVIVFGGMMVCGFTLEVATAPDGRGPMSRLRSIGANLAYGAVAIGAARVCSALIAGGHMIPPPLLDLRDHEGPFATAALAVAWLATYDIGYYWWHRAQHRHAILWRIHRLHHEQTETDVTTYLRHHWLEDVCQTVLIAIPMMALVRIPANAAAAALAANSALVILAHASVRLDFGPLTRVLTGPASHAVHHSADRRLSRSNLCGLFPAVDMAFGTWSDPRRIDGAAEGVDAGNDGAATEPTGPRE